MRSEKSCPSRNHCAQASSSGDPDSQANRNASCLISMHSNAGQAAYKQAAPGFLAHVLVVRERVAGNSSGIEGSLAEARPACTHPCRVRKEPATIEAAATRRSWIERRVPEVPAISRRTRSKGPERSPPRRVTQPLLPRFSGTKAGFLFASTDMPIRVSASDEAIPSALSEGLDACPFSSSIETAAP